MHAQLDPVARRQLAIWMLAAVALIGFAVGGGGLAVILFFALG